MFDAYLSRYGLGWKLLVPGSEVSLEYPPSEWWLSERIAQELNITIPEASTAASARAEHRAGQLAFDFSGQDSGKQSG